MTAVAGLLPAVIHSVVTRWRGDDHEACVRASTRLLSLTNFKVYFENIIIIWNMEYGSHDSVDIVLGCTMVNCYHTVLTSQ